MATPNMNTQASEEQIVYAKILEKGMFTGLALMVITFVLYVFRIVPPMIPRYEIANYWRMPVKEYLEAINNNYLHLAHPPTGWAWIYLINKGDFLNFIPIAILSGITIMCYLVIVPTLLRKKDTAYVVMCLAEAAILTLAASGLLTAGGH
ncbi:MAG: hypothetical protein A2521_14365 [Deltaproteobacteria bacterium RIFOXYD12_FULL_57_12]|nr:MAG: hypothetical protein A2521_14365 [Deltaproteobacteria bacterium RIFOXYD12_FULL_57_12]